ncbi:hypothetical protein, partial [uncultured Microbacterium sp.]|uniref:hypothetical protein n=1 Tax=uncultured Microbacterium sp. TaxID=191216 RepID=UPI0025F8205C
MRRPVGGPETSARLEGACDGDVGASTGIFIEESRRSTVSSQVTGVGTSSEGEFGANEWLVDELYEQ